MRGNIRDVAGMDVTGIDQGDHGRRGEDTTVADMPGRGGGVCLKSVASKDVSVVKKTDVVRGDLCVGDVVRPIVVTNSLVPCRDRVGGGGNTVPVVPDEDRPVGGDERSHPHISKPNIVRGGLRGRVQFWEMKTEQLLNENQDGITAEFTSNFNTEGKLGASYRKQKT